MLRRDRLLRMLDGDGGTAVTLLSAPAATAGRGDPRRHRHLLRERTARDFPDA